MDVAVRLEWALLSVGDAVTAIVEHEWMRSPRVRLELTLSRHFRPCFIFPLFPLLLPAHIGRRDKTGTALVTREH